MEYYIVLLVFYAITLIFLRLVFAEIEGRQARKMSNVRYFLRYHSKFVYRNQFSIIFVAFLCYMIVSVEKAFSTMWFLQLLGFIAVGVISDALSQIVYYYYINFRFKKDIVESEELKNEIEQAVLNQGEELMQQTIPSYEPHRIIEDYLNEENHLAVISVDGGNFTSQFEKLPPITYSVELNPTKARETLEEKGVKVTTFTSQGKMPFKDEKLDVVVNELSNYDKFEMYRILKPGGYLVVDQLGSDNYKEIINMFIELLSAFMRGIGYSSTPAIICVLGICGLRILYIYTLYPMIASYDHLLMIYPVSWVCTALALAIAYYHVQKKELSY